MVSSTLDTIATGNQLGHVTRPARALIGWMQQNEAQLMLAGRRIDKAGSHEHIQKASNAIASVEGRVSGIDQSSILENVPNDLNDYINEIKRHESFEPFNR